MAGFLDLLLPETATGTDVGFLLCAALGSVFFALKVLGVILWDPFDGDGDTHASIGGHHDDAHDIDTFDALKLLSINSIAAFFAIFGWAGLSAHVQFQQNVLVSLLLALVFGFSAMFLVAYVFYLLKKLTSEGATFRMEDTIGKSAEVYERIPANGRGKVHITVNGMLREIEAETLAGLSIDSFSTVRITALAGRSHVIVEPFPAQ